MYGVEDLVADSREVGVDHLNSFILEEPDHLMEHEALVQASNENDLQVGILQPYFHDRQHRFRSRSTAVGGLIAAVIRCRLQIPPPPHLFDPLLKACDVGRGLIQVVLLAQQVLIKLKIKVKLRENWTRRRGGGGGERWWDLICAEVILFWDEGAELHAQVLHLDPAVLLHHLPLQLTGSGVAPALHLDPAVSSPPDRNSQELLLRKNEKF